MWGRFGVCTSTVLSLDAVAYMAYRYGERQAPQGVSTDGVCYMMRKISCVL